MASPTDSSESPPAPSREELRRRLRERRTTARNAGESAGGAARRGVDVGTELLRRGVDDPSLLRLAQGVGRDPRRAMDAVRAAMRSVEEDSHGETRAAEEEEEEAPPPPLPASRRALPPRAQPDDDDEEGLPPPAA